MTRQAGVPVDKQDSEKTSEGGVGDDSQKDGSVVCGSQAAYHLEGRMEKP